MALTTEKPKSIEAYLSDRLKRGIDACEWLSPKLPFYFGSSKNPAYLANEVYERMQTLRARWLFRLSAASPQRHVRGSQAAGRISA